MNTAQAIINSGFDLDQLDAIQDITHKCAVVFDEDGNPKAGFILAGRNSQEYIDGEKNRRIENMVRNNSRKKTIDVASEAGVKLIVETVDGNARATALSVVVGWFGFEKKGVEVPFDKAMVPVMFDKCPTWQQKVLSDLDNEANFQPASSQG